MTHLLRLLTTVFAVATLNATADQVILVFGDSLSSGYGLAPDQPVWTELLQAQLVNCADPYHVVNSSRSGETTAGGLARIERELYTHHPQWVLLELGGNDGLQGLPPKQIQVNLQAIITRIVATQAQPVLIETPLPASLGRPYQNRFSEVYHHIAATNQIPLATLIQNGMPIPIHLLQDDKIHPNGAGQHQIAQSLLDFLAPLLGCSS